MFSRHFIARGRVLVFRLQRYTKIWKREEGRGKKLEVRGKKLEVRGKKLEVRGKKLAGRS